MAAGGRHEPVQRHAHLRPESGTEPQRVADGVRAALRQVELAEIRVRHLVVRHRRHDPGLDRLDGDDVLDADAHRMAGETLGVGDHDLTGRGPEHAPYGIDLRLGAATPGRRVGLVGDEDRVRRDLVAVDAPPALGRRDEVLHHLTDVVRIESGAVEGAVGGDRAEDLGDGLDAASLSRRCGLDHDRRGPHAEDHAVASEVERDGGFGHDVIGGRRARGEESRPHPLEQPIAGHVVARHDHDPLATAGADPVLGQRHGLRGAGAGRVDLRVRPPGADVLGKLRVAHRQRVEQELAIELVRVVLQLSGQRVDPMIELLGQEVASTELLDAGPQAPEVLHTLAKGLVEVVALELTDQRVVAREGRREDDTGGVPVRLGQHPSLLQHATGGGRLVVHHERDPGVSERIEAGADGQHARHVEGLGPLGGEAELLHEVDGAGPTGQLDHVGLVLDRLEAGASLLGLDESGDVLVDDLLALLDRDRVDELLAGEDGGHLVVAEDPLTARKAQAGAGHHDWLGEGGRLRHVTEELVALLEHVSEHPPESHVGVASGRRRGDRHDHGLRPLGRAVGCGRHRRRRRGCSGRSSLNGGHLVRLSSYAESGGVEAAQGLVEGRDVTLLRVVGEQADDVRVLPEDLLDEPLQRPLRADLDEHSAAGVVQGAQTLDELHGRGDLATQQVDHAVDDVGPHRIEVTVDVGHEGDRRRLEVQPSQHRLQRLGRRSDDLGVEGVAHREEDRLMAGGAQAGDGRLDCLGGATDDGLRVAVDVGDDDVAVDLPQRALDLLEGGEHRGHPATVLDSDVGHLAAPSTDGLEGVGEAQRSAGDEGAVLAQAVTHHHLGLDAVRAEQASERDVDGEDRRLGDLGLAQLLVGRGGRPSDQPSRRTRSR